jgi:hypothetical protein
MIGERKGLPRGRVSPLHATGRPSFGRASGRCRRAFRRAVVPIAVTVMRRRREGRCLRRRRAIRARRGGRMGQAGEAGEDHAAPHHRRDERAPHQGSHEDHLLRSSRRHSTIATFRSAWSRLRVRSETPREEEQDVPKLRPGRGSGVEDLGMLSGSARSSMDRASDYGSEGWGFDSLRARIPRGALPSSIRGT